MRVPAMIGLPPSTSALIVMRSFMVIQSYAETDDRQPQQSPRCGAGSSGMHRLRLLRFQILYFRFLPQPPAERLVQQRLLQGVEGGELLQCKTLGITNEILHLV